MPPTAQRMDEIACVPGAIPKEERAAHFHLAKRLFSEIAEHREQLSDGYAFRFPADAIQEVARFVANERRCCPFMQFEISIAPNADSLSLRMTGPEGTRGVLDAELDPCDCGVGSCGGTIQEVTCKPERKTWRNPLRVVARGGNGGRIAKWTTAGGILAALGICAACCLLPFILVGAGVAGAWIATLDALVSYKWYFVVATVGLLGYGFYVAYRKPKTGCAGGSSPDGVLNIAAD